MLPYYRVKPVDIIAAVAIHDDGRSVRYIVHLADLLKNAIQGTIKRFTKTQVCITEIKFKSSVMHNSK